MRRKCLRRRRPQRSRGEDAVSYPHGQPAGVKLVYRSVDERFSLELKLEQNAGQDEVRVIVATSHTFQSRAPVTARPGSEPAARECRGALARV